MSESDWFSKQGVIFCGPTPYVLREIDKFLATESMIFEYEARGLVFPDHARYLARTRPSPGLAPPLRLPGRPIPEKYRSIVL